MRIVSRLAFVAVPAALSLLTGCETGGLLSRAGGSGPYHVTAYKPNDPSAVRVKVSLSKQNVYVMEGDRCLMAAAISVGLPNKPTPRGSFTIYSKQEHKRSGSYGFSVQGNNVTPCSGNCEDETIGPKVQRVDDSRAPDPDPHIMISDAAFQRPSGTLLE